MSAAGERVRRAGELQAGDGVAIDGPFGRGDLGTVVMLDEHPSGYLAVAFVRDGSERSVMCLHWDDEVVVTR